MKPNLFPPTFPKPPTTRTATITACLLSLTITAAQLPQDGEPALPTPFLYLPFDQQADTHPPQPDFAATTYGDTTETPAIPSDLPLRSTWSPQGLVGGAWDGSALRERESANVPIWGTSALNTAPSRISSGLAETDRILISLWFHSDSPNPMGRLLKTPAFQLTWRGDFCQTAFGKPNQWLSSRHFAFWRNNPSEWKFIAVYIERTAEQTQLRYYAGSETQIALPGAEASIAATEITDSDEPLWLTIGNSEYDGNRPFVGKIDEVRIWLGDDATALLPQIESVRRLSLR